MSKGDGLQGYTAFNLILAASDGGGPGKRHQVSSAVFRHSAIHEILKKNVHAGIEQYLCSRQTKHDSLAFT